MNIKELKDFLIKNNWKETDLGFVADNLLVYYRKDFKEWRLKDMNKFTNMDITSIDLPFSEKEKQRFRIICSNSHKSS
ncbi:hypothetical protein [Aquimarina macrocephali]|uniref:hypothetical protein n=1 Tax=Aquimarina macrocephali TaxID=666563 RepID=UPI003F668D92